MEGDRVTIQILLEQLGLNFNVSETYWALLNLDNVSVRKVADFSGINRGTTYDAIKSLIAMGLVSKYRRGQREYFTAESPEKIYDLIRDKRKNLIQIQKQAERTIPEVLARKVQLSGKPLVKYYENDEGIVVVLKDVLHTCGQLKVPEYYAYSSKSLRKYLYRRFPKFTFRRTSEGIFVKVIAVGEGGEAESLSERKWMTDDSLGGHNMSSSYVLIYGTKVAHIAISPNDTPYAVVIDDANVATMQRLLFDRLWTIL